MPEISPYIVITLVAIVVAQVLKFAIHAFSNEIDFKQLVKSDGTPSSTVAAAASLVVASLAVDGTASSVAALTVVLGLFYIWNQIKSLGLRQVALSSLVGLAIGLILSVTYWSDSLSWFFDNPSSNEIRTQFIGFGALLIFGEVLSFLARRKSMRKLPTSRKLNRAFRLSITLPTIVGLMITFAQKETLGMFDVRIWTFLVLGWIVASTVWFWRTVYRHARVHLAEEAEHFKEVKSKHKSKKKKTKRKK